jgi:hypothetical protein
MIVFPSRLPEPDQKPGVLNARIVSREVSTQAAHCCERTASDEANGSVNAAG